MPKNLFNFVFAMTRPNELYKMRQWCNKKTYLLLCFVALTAFSAACNSRESSEAEKCAQAFACNYFNLEFDKAAKLCTKKSLKWIRLQASNILQQDIDTLNTRKKTAECEIESIDADNDRATAVLKIRNFLECDSVGKPGYICKQASYTVDLIKTNNVWQINLTNPLKKNN